MGRPVVGISLDLDNKWSYMKTHGHPEWEQLPTYLDVVVPRILDFFDHRGVKLTFFAVGLDAAQEKNHNALRSIAEAGHEIGNHSYHHEPWLHRYTDEQVEFEIGETERIIEEVTGARCVGFRGPGFSTSPTVLRTLIRHGYQYDASTFPTFIGPLARAYFFMGSGLNKQDKATRSQLFGTLRDGFQPLNPYWKELSNGRILEIPVTTMPVTRLPIHVSYLLYLSGYSPFLARRYLATAVGLCRLTETRPSMLLHALDFLGGEDRVGLDFFPAAQLAVEKKLALVGDVIDRLADSYELCPMSRYTEAVCLDEAARQMSAEVAVSKRDIAPCHAEPVSGKSSG